MDDKMLNRETLVTFENGCSTTQIFEKKKLVKI